MAELGAASNDLLNELLVMMIGYGIDVNEAKGKLYMLLHGYQITKSCTDVVLYEGDMNTDLMKRFLMAKIVAGLSERTIRFYRRDITKSLLRIGKNADTISADDIRYYIAQRMRDGVRVVTINNELRNLSSFFTWMVESEIIRINPVTKIDKIRVPKEQKKAFTDYEIEVMRAALRDEYERAVFETLLSTGCRVAELCSMRIGDVKEDGSVMILGKGNKYRTVYLNAKATVAVDAFLKVRSDSSSYLFPKSSIRVGEKGRTMQVACEWFKRPGMVSDEKRDNSGIEAMMRKIGKRAGVEDVHPHRFRRTCATMALNRGMPLTLVSKMLGHASVSTTQIYLDLNDEELAQAHRKYVT